MVPFLVLPQTTPACSSPQPLCFHRLAASCLSFSALRPLFSLAYSLFGQKQGGGYTLENPSFKISNIQTLFPRAVCHSVNPRSARALLCASGFVQPSFLLALCFHNDTNRFSRNSLVFTSIQVGVCALLALPTSRGRSHFILAPCPRLRCQSICPQTPAVTCPLAARKAQCSQPRDSTNSMVPFPPSKT